MTIKRGKPVSLSKKALEILENYEWKGNVRELENCIENICAFHNGPIIDTQDLPSWLISGKNTDSNLDLPYKDAQEGFEKSYLNNLMELHDGNIKKAAAFARVEMSTLYRKLNKYGLRR